MNSVVRVAAGTFVLLCLIGVASAETVERTSPADPRGEVEIVNVAGSVQVTGWDRAEVQVSAKLGKGVERLEFQHDGARTFIEIVLTHGNSTGTELTIHVPRDSRVITNTVSADQKIEEVRGAQRLQSVSGDLRTQIWSGDFEARTVSGEIIAKGKEKARTGRTRVSTVSGEIDLDNIGDEIDADSVSGDMKVRAPMLSRAGFKTTNGSLQLASALAGNARIDVESINGDQSLVFDGGIDAEFDINTFNGRIDNCFGPKPKKKHEHGPGIELRFKEGEGRAQVRVKTLNGKVTICRNPR